MDGTTCNTDFAQDLDCDSGNNLHRENLDDCESAIGLQKRHELNEATQIVDVAEDDNLVCDQQNQEESDHAVVEAFIKSEEWEATDEASRLLDTTVVTQEIPPHDEPDATSERGEVVTDDEEEKPKDTIDNSSPQIETADHTSAENGVGKEEKRLSDSTKLVDDSHTLTPDIEPLIKVDDFEVPDSIDMQDIVVEMSETDIFNEVLSAHESDTEAMSESPMRRDHDSRNSFSEERELQEENDRKESMPLSLHPQYDAKRSNSCTEEIANVQNIETNGMEIHVEAIPANISEPENESEVALGSLIQTGVPDSQSGDAKLLGEKSEHESPDFKSSSPQPQDCLITISETEVQCGQTENNLKPSLDQSQEDTDNIVSEKKELTKTDAVPKRLRYSKKLETHIEPEDKNDDTEEIRIEDMPREELEQLLRKTIRKRTQWIFVALLFLITSWILACTTAVFVFNYRSLQDACGDPNI